MKSTISKRIIETKRDKKHNAIIFEMELAHMPEKYRQIAKEIDGKAYGESCFAFRYQYSITANRYFVKGESHEREAYYLDEDGDEHFLDFKIPQNVLNIATDQCNNRLIKMGIKKQRKSRKKVPQPVIKTLTRIICVYSKDLFKGRRNMVVGQLALF